MTIMSISEYTKDEAPVLSTGYQKTFHISHTVPDTKAALMKLFIFSFSSWYSVILLRRQII